MAVISCVVVEQFMCGCDKLCGGGGVENGFKGALLCALINY